MKNNAFAIFMTTISVLMLVLRINNIIKHNEEIKTRLERIEQEIVEYEF